MANLIELFDNIVQMQNLNGVPLANGKLYVYALGRTRLMDTWSDVDGESLNTNPIILDDAGQAHCFVSDDFDYTLVVCDAYDNEIFSIDKYLYSKGEHSHADVAVAPSEHIGVSSYHVGETTVYVPYIQGELGKTYHGIEPIVVNNQENKISARNIPLGVQSPLYFAEDSESACIIAMSGEYQPVTGMSGYATTGDLVDLATSVSETYQPKGDYATHDDLSGFMEESKLETADGKITGYDGTAFAGGGSVDPSEFIPWSASGNFATSGDLNDKLDTTAFSTVSGDFITAIPDSYASKDFVLSSVSSKLDSTAFSTVSGDFITALPEGLLNESGFEYDGDKISAYNGSAFGTELSGYELSAGNGISIDNYPIEQKTVISVTGNYATEDWVTGQGYLTAETDWTNTITAASANAYNEATAAIPAPFDPSYLSGQIDTKLDSAIYANDSGTFLTAHQDLSDYQTISGMTAYQSAGNYATVEDIESATSGKANISATIPVVSSLHKFVTATDYIGAVADTSGNFYQIVTRSGEPQSAWVIEYRKDAIDRRIYYGNYSTTWPATSILTISPYYMQLADAFNVSPGWFNVSGVITANTTGFTANNLAANTVGIIANNLTATNLGISASGLSAGAGASFCIKCAPEAFSGGGLTGFTFSSQNTAFGSAVLTTAAGNSVVQVYSPKFEARNTAGAGFSIEGSGAKGYDHNGNVVWDTTKPAKLIGWSNYQGTAIDPRAAGINGGIIATVYPDQIPASMSISSAPYSYMNGNGFFATNTSNGTTLSADTIYSTISLLHIGMSATAAMNPGDVYYRKYNNDTSATDVWSLTGSVQKREIEGDTATSAITAIAGSAIGGGVPAGTMNESAFEYDANDKISGYNGSAFAGGSDVPEGVMVESGLEYNAVNEISAYNGSAIAQYGAEKQWLVHDDTLVHAANSAQYALGVNISAVGELLGVAGPVINQETFAGYWNGQPLYQQLVQMTFSSNSTSTAAIPDELYSSAVANGRRWIDPSNSFIHYGSQDISLPISWMLASDRRGSISIINNALHYRGVDGANTSCTAYVCVKYRKA